MTRPIASVLIAALALAATLSSLALAHGGEAGSADSASLASQAIAYLQADPPDLATAGDLIQDALTAEPAATDVNLELLKAAGIALKQGAATETVQLLGRALGRPSQPLGPLITVKVGAGYYVAFAIAVLLVGLGAYGLGRRTGREKHPNGAPPAAGASS